MVAAGLARVFFAKVVISPPSDLIDDGSHRVSLRFSFVKVVVGLLAGFFHLQE